MARDVFDDFGVLERAAAAFRASGWDAYNLAGGLTAWVESGQPLEPEGGTVASRRPGPQN